MNIKDIEKGVDIQLALYLDYCKNVKYKKINKNIIPCGAFYLWIDNPIIEIDSLDDKKNVEKIKNKKLAYVGLINEDENALHKINENLTFNKRDKIYVDKETGFTLSGEVLTNNSNNEEKKSFNDVINSAKDVALKTMEKIRQGDITAEPYKNNYCEYCQFVSTCMKEKRYNDDAEMIDDKKKI